MNNENIYLIESEDGEILKPFYIVCCFSGTLFSEITRKIVKSEYCHVSVSFNATLNKCYSFNGNNKVNAKGGFSIENIQEYNLADNSELLVSMILLKEKDWQLLKDKISSMKKLQSKTTYNVMNCINVLLHKVQTNNESMSMICSQFVYSLFLSILQDDSIVHTNGNNLVLPQDIANGLLKNPKVYTVFKGYTKDYKYNHALRVINNIKQTGVIFKEDNDLNLEEAYDYTEWLYNTKECNNLFNEDFNLILNESSYYNNISWGTMIPENENDLNIIINKIVKPSYENIYKVSNNERKFLKKFKKMNKFYDNVSKLYNSENWFEFFISFKNMLLFLNKYTNNEVPWNNVEISGVGNLEYTKHIK